MTNEISVRAVNVLLTLCIALLVVNIALTFGMSGKMDAQTALLTSISVGVKDPMSTTYTDTSQLEHTVTSPLQEDPDENVRIHKIWLTSSFCVFPPQDPPTWWEPGECP